MIGSHGYPTITGTWGYPTTLEPRGCPANIGNTWTSNIRCARRFASSSTMSRLDSNFSGLAQQREAAQQYSSELSRGYVSYVLSSQILHDWQVSRISPHLQRRTPSNQKLFLQPPLQKPSIYQGDCIGYMWLPMGSRKGNRSFLGRALYFQPSFSAVLRRYS